MLAFDPKQQITENIERNFHSEFRSEYWLYLEEIKQINTIYFQNVLNSNRNQISRSSKQFEIVVSHKQLHHFETLLTELTDLLKRKNPVR